MKRNRHPIMLLEVLCALALIAIALYPLSQGFFEAYRIQYSRMRILQRHVIWREMKMQALMLLYNGGVSYEDIMKDRVFMLYPPQNASQRQSGVEPVAWQLLFPLVKDAPTEDPRGDELERVLLVEVKLIAPCGTVYSFDEVVHWTPARIEP